MARSEIEGRFVIEARLAERERFWNIAPVGFGIGLDGELRRTLVTAAHCVVGSTRESHMAGTFELFKDKKGEFRFRLKAGNGEIVLSSEGYKDRAGALSGIESVKKNAEEIGRYEMKAGAGGKHHFVLKAANNQVIGSSEMYGSESARENGIKSVREAARGAAVEDKTA
jgi:uncharacterized protein YegP (UPF0339 family)